MNEATTVDQPQTEVNALVPFTPELRLGMPPAFHAGIKKVAESAEANGAKLYISLKLGDKGYTVAIDDGTNDLSDPENEYLLSYIDFSMSTRMYLVTDDDDLIHRVSTPRAVFGLLW